jgi:hypothetical protein
MKNEVIQQSEASDRARRLIAEGKEDAVAGFMKIGAGFALVVEFKLHRLENLTLAQYIAGTGMSWAKAHQALSVFRKFGHMDTKGVLHSRLIEMTSLKFDDAQREEAVEKARLLGPRDFERFVAEKKGKPIPSECEHKELVTICSICRQRVK